ncbi:MULTISPECIES: META domain-containing protein [Flavobacterium]|uniref:META domain-containing protein n=1 Tax=Flavobacterium TaxID=237 RepID=UPI001FCBC603|nr:MULTISPECIES: META domain-containing protein [Flavobacterium]UOK41962.1 META domain-containing protein [Flavobacterium enshiense]
MRKCLFTAVIMCLSFISCNSVKTPTNIEGQLEKLNGSWELVGISETGVVFDELYRDKKPTINFEVNEGRVSGNNSCNAYTGKLNANGNKISFKDPLAMTKMMCGDGKGETVYMQNLLKIDSYSVSKDGETLNFNMGKKTLMRFKRQ